MLAARRAWKPRFTPRPRKRLASERNGSWLDCRLPFDSNLPSNGRPRLQPTPFTDFELLDRPLLWFAFQRLAKREKKDGTLAFRVRRKEVNHVIIEEG